MVNYEALNLGDYKRRIRAEFGFADEADKNELITNKVNFAISAIVRRKGNFPWQRRELFLDLPLGGSGTGTFTQGSRSVTTTSLVSTDKRRILSPNDPGREGTHGYLITAASTSAATLQTQWRGSSGSGTPFSIQNGFVELPLNVMKVDVATKLTTFGDEVFSYLPPREFDSVRFRTVTWSKLENHFTVVPDPLAETGTYFIAIYPYLTSLTTLRGYYFTVPPKLELDDDEPIVPPNDREVVFNLACYYVGLGRTDSARIDYYQRMAQEGMERMAQEYALYEHYDTDRYEDSVGGDVAGPEFYSGPGFPPDYIPNTVLIP